MNTQADQYYLKALDAYPFELKNTLENLQFALSYENEHSGALHMMGKLYVEQLGNYKTGQKYLEEAFAKNPQEGGVGYDLALCFICQNKLEKAQKLIDYLHKIDKTQFAQLRVLEAYVYERKKQYCYAIKLLKSARVESYNDSYTNIINAEIQRIKKKRKAQSKTV